MLHCAGLASKLIGRNSVPWDDLKRIHAVSGYSERGIGIKKVGFVHVVGFHVVV